MAGIRLWVKKYKEPLYLMGCLGLFIALTQLMGITCLIKELTGVSCPGCGMTRATMALVKLDFAAAVYYHPLVFFLPPVVTGLIVFRVRKMQRSLRVLIAASAVLLLVVYFYRMLVLSSPIVVFEPQNSLVARLWLRIASVFR